MRSYLHPKRDIQRLQKFGTNYLSLVYRYICTSYLNWFLFNPCKYHNIIKSKQPTGKKTVRECIKLYWLMKKKQEKKQTDN